MKRTAGVCMVLAALGGCMSTNRPSGSDGGGFGGGYVASVPGVQGPWGQPVAMPAGASSGQWGPSGPVVRASYQTGACAGGACSTPTGAIRPAGCSSCGAGGACAAGGSGAGAMAGVVSAIGAIPPGAGARFATQRTSVNFVNPRGMTVSWFAPAPVGGAGMAANVLVTPRRFNFLQGAIYRLKLSTIANHEGMVLYPTLEVVPGNVRTETFLAHTAVPVSFTEEDFEQVAAGNYLVKVVYLPDPAFQDLAATGPDEIVSSRLEPGIDPIAEARRRGSILLVVRMGNINLEMPHSPAMDAPNPYPGNMQYNMAPGTPGTMPSPNAMMGAGNPMSSAMPLIPTPATPSMMPGPMPAAAMGQANASSGMIVTPAQLAGQPLPAAPPVSGKSFWDRQW